MLKLFRNKKFIAFLVGLILFLSWIGVTNKENTKSSWPERFVVDTFDWVQGIVYKPIGAVGHFFVKIGELQDLYKEQSQLKRTLSMYAMDTAKLNALEQENERLKTLLRYTKKQKKKVNYTYHVASVVGYGNDTYRKTLDIDLGANDGMKVNMAVVTNKGLIGRIIRVTNLYSTVELITSLNDSNANSKGIIVTASGKDESFGTILNYDQKKHVLLVTKIRQDDPLEVGDTIVTSAYGTLYPQGLIVGKVLTRKISKEGLTYVAQVKPSADFDRLREVLVIDTAGR
jgi:rod shape-determining protein MreC